MLLENVRVLLKNVEYERESVCTEQLQAARDAKVRGVRGAGGLRQDGADLHAGPGVPHQTCALGSTRLSLPSSAFVKF